MESQENQRAKIVFVAHLRQSVTRGKEKNQDVQLFTKFFYF